MAYRRFKFKQYQKKIISKKGLKICTSQKQLYDLTKINQQPPLSVQNAQMIPLNKSQTYVYFTSRKISESVTPTLSERKKSVSFSDPLEEIYIVESFKTMRP